MENMDLWHKVEKTPPEHTKAITGKSYSGTSPKPHWIVMKATETFGPCGIGWGFTIEERVEDGALIAPGFYHRMHIAKVTVWYIWNDKRGQVEHIGGTEFSGQRASGRPFTDEDAAKKSVTDALVKALSMIGFAGDIFMGRYDDSKYVQSLKAEGHEAANDTPSPPPKPRASDEDRDAYCVTFRNQVSLCKNRFDLEKAWKNASVKRAELGIDIGDDCYVRLHGFCKDRIEEFGLPDNGAEK